MSKYKLIDIETDNSCNGEPEEYENPADRFIIWAIVHFVIDKTNYSETVVFDCGHVGNVPVWESLPDSMIFVNEEQDAFLNDCLKKAGEALEDLQKQLAEND